MRMRDLKERATELFPSQGEVGDRIASDLGESSFEELRKKYEAFRPAVRQLYLEILGLT